MKLEIDLPDDLSYHTATLVKMVAEVMGDKLKTAEDKGRRGWEKPDWQESCTEQLFRHLAKGDPIDCMNFLAFMWWHRWPVGDNMMVKLASENDQVILITSRILSCEQIERVQLHFKQQSENGQKFFIVSGVEQAVVIRKPANEVAT